MYVPCMKPTNRLRSELGSVLDRPLEVLSGGELQRFAIALTAIKQADVYMFDEPSSYLDVKQRLTAARVIRALSTAKKYAIIQLVSTMC